MLSWFFVAAFVIIALGVLLVMWIRSPSRSDLGLVRFVSGLALVSAEVIGLVTFVGVALMFGGQDTSVSVPVEAQVPRLPPGIFDVDGPTATIVGGADHLQLSILGLSIGTRIVLGLGQVAGGATFVLIALLVRRLARSAIAADA